MPKVYRIRPASANTRMMSHKERSNGSRSPRGLLQKIEALSRHRSRNMQALDKLRHISSIRAWEEHHDPIPRQRGMSSTPRIAGKSGTHSADVSGDEDEPREAPLKVPPKTKAGYTITKVAPSSERSRAPHATVVEPFRSMETHAAAWARKMREHDEVRRERCRLAEGRGEVSPSIARRNSISEMPPSSLKHSPVAIKGSTGLLSRPVSPPISDHTLRRVSGACGSGRTRSLQERRIAGGSCLLFGEGGNSAA